MPAELLFKPRPAEDPTFTDPPALMSMLPPKYETTVDENIVKSCATLMSMSEPDLVKGTNEKLSATPRDWMPPLEPRSTESAVIENLPGPPTLSAGSCENDRVPICGTDWLPW